MAVVINGTTGISGVDGSAGTPALQGGDPDTGIFYGTNTVSIATNGVAAVTVDATGSTTFAAQTLFPDGSVSAPAISNTGDVNTGVYFPAADNVAIATNGTAALTVDSNQNVSITGVIDGLSTPGAATGTGSSSGGTLAAATYYVRIVAFDSAGNTTNAGTESTGVTTTGSTSSIAYTWTAVTGATGYRVYFSTTSGTYASGYFVTTSASYTLTTTSGSIAVGLPASNTTGISLMSNQSFKRNKIINGDMRVDQRNNGASLTITTGNEYCLDRYQGVVSVSSKFSVQQSTTAPVGFVNSLKATSLSAYTVGAAEQFSVRQHIEGLNISDLAWGTANAKTVTLSFQVYSSLTGTFGGALYNSNGSRSYPFSYSISSANTWTSISITIAGDTTGTWLTTNGVGITVNFGLGVGSSQSATAGTWAAGFYASATGATSVVGTNGATWYVTGVQLEVGSVATPYERQIYSDQLLQCQRYYQIVVLGYVGPATSGVTLNGNGYTYVPAVRTSPTITWISSAQLNSFPNTSGTTGGVTSSGFFYYKAANGTNNSGASYADTLSVSAEL